MDSYKDNALSLDQRADDLISRLTLEEKVSLVVGTGFTLPGFYEPEFEEKVPGRAGETFPVERLGITGLVLLDGPAGVRIDPVRDATSGKTYYGTAFPVATLIASTWDTGLAKEVGQAMGNEVKEYGGDVLLAPAINIHRNPLGGRNFEYMSEDPLVAGKIGSAFIQGLQALGVGSSLKHFAANNQETNRGTADTIVSQRALREIYLKGFEIAVKEAQPWTVMSAYNKINGLYASQSKDLLTRILREDWGYEGFVMTDWLAGDDRVEQMIAGNDLIQPGCPEDRQILLDAIVAGELSEDVVTRNAKRILRVIMQSPAYTGYAYTDEPDARANIAVARKAAAEGIVLLKNVGTLPLEKTSLKIGSFGNASYHFISGGTGSGDVNSAYTVSLVEGLENAGFTINAQLKSDYNHYRDAETAKLPQKRSFLAFIPPLPERPLDRSYVESMANQTDIALVTIGRLSGETRDRVVDGDFNLTDAERNMIAVVSEVYHAAGKKVVLILNVGNVIETASWRDQVDAIVLPWQGGQEAGNALVDVLKGAVNPSGKLPTTFVARYEDAPSAKNFPGEEYGEIIDLGAFLSARPLTVIYEEGLYVGYRYFGTFAREVAYPFGFGLSYTSFDYDNLLVNHTDGRLEISLSVANSGVHAGKEVIQVYISAPGKSMHKPVMELRAFAKTRQLAPGAHEPVSFTLSPHDLASFDTERSSWVIEPGKYEVRIGASSEDIRLTGRFTISGEIIVEKVSDALRPTMAINELMS